MRCGELPLESTVQGKTPQTRSVPHYSHQVPYTLHVVGLCVQLTPENTILLVTFATLNIILLFLNPCEIYNIYIYNYEKVFPRRSLHFITAGALVQ